MCSIRRKLFLALEKVRIVKTTPPQVPFLRQKKSPPSKISIPPLPISSKYFTSMMEFFLQK